MPTSDRYIQENHERFESIIKGLNAGIYEINLQNNSCWYSAHIYEVLGFESDKSADIEDLLVKVIPHDQEKLRTLISETPLKEEPFIFETQLLQPSGNYHWFRITGQTQWLEGKACFITGFLSDIENRIRVESENKKNEFLLEEAGYMAKVGGWELLLGHSYVTWAKEVCLIHEMPIDYKPKLEDAINFYSPKYIPVIEAAVQEALTHGTPFDLELKIITATKREVWVRAIGKPVYDESSKQIIGLCGVFQDIDERKEKELALQTSFNLINEQNQRLVNFANIVSHNLKSHAANLELTLSLMELETDPKELEQLRNNLNKISKSFNETVEHLKDIVVIQSESNPMKVPLKFEAFLMSVMESLETEISRVNASISYDFNTCPDIEYIPAYLESILLNLISNAIKYRKPETNPIINVRTYRENGRVVLEVSDNGLGIDLDKNGHKVFGMYKTFHNNPNAKGIGLFITRNQIEAMGGSISVSSKVGEGSTFKIIF